VHAGSIAGGMAPETAASIGLTLENSGGRVQVCSGLCGVAGGETQATGLRIETDAMLDPTAVELQDRGTGEVSGSEGPADG
jgi:hypothetical protein